MLFYDNPSRTRYHNMEIKKLTRSSIFILILTSVNYIMYELHF